MTEADRDRYEKACHAMMSGVKMMMNYEHPEAQTPDNAKDPSTGPKHLRCGVNNALCDQSALVMLLIDKGVINRDDYERAIADMMEDEVKRYEDRINNEMFKKTGQRVNFKLG